MIDLRSVLFLTGVLLTGLTVTITSGTTFTEITELGYYSLNFSVFDSAGNESTGYTLLNVVGS